MAQSERNLTAIFQDTANAIRAKTGGTDQINPRDFADEIEAIPTGSQEIVPGPNDNVVVYDYDGTVLDAQQVAVGQEYTLPEPPTHEGLTFDGWSCSTAAVNGKITIPISKDVAVGAVYHPTSGALELDIVAPKNIAITLGNITKTQVDWGDGTTNNETSHTYAQDDNYTIKITTSATTISQEAVISSSLKYIIRRARIPSGVTSIENIAAFQSLTNIVIPSGVININSSAFQDCKSLACVVLPSSVTKVDYASFQGCPSLTSVVLPSSVTTIGNNVFSGCYSLTRIVIPNSFNSLKGSFFADCWALKSLSIPTSITSEIAGTSLGRCYSLIKFIVFSSVSSVSGAAFSGCCSCGVFDFSHCQYVPFLINVNAFNGINANAKIIVPDSLYDTWVAASNWSDLASHIVRASEA